MSGYSYAEVERMLATGDIDGRLTRHDLPTPALLLDLDAFESNVGAMVRHCREHVGRHGGLRPDEQPTARFPVLGGDTADLLVRYLRYRICPEWS